MPTKRNYQGNQQNYDASNGEYEAGPKNAFSSFESPKSESKVAQLGSDNFKSGLKDNEKEIFSRATKYKNPDKPSDLDGTMVVDELPNGWRINENATTAPKGYMWIDNNKSWFDSNRKKSLMKDPDYSLNDKERAIKTLKKFGVDTEKLHSPADVRVLERTHHITDFTKKEGKDFFNATQTLRDELKKEALPRAKRDTSKDITPQFDKEVEKYFQLAGRNAEDGRGGRFDSIKQYFKEVSKYDETIDDEIAEEKHSVQEMEQNLNGAHPNYVKFYKEKKDRLNWLMKNRDRLDTYYKDIK